MNGSTPRENFFEVAEDDDLMRDVAIDGDMIRLGQFLKLADLIETGGEGKVLIASGDVTVNGEIDTRRGRQLHRGDVVEVLGRSARVAS
ncbi:RNA-binding S4 domain-containing protein [Actinoplanes sp. CA-142083]|uniref:RNA-binding S4 domain-containing protein n=1 Tax=Actinoplanes sp. CA-142083 TaxID=3239903 RepID=UPI003D905195